MTIDEKIDEIKKKSYKHKISIYSKREESLVRVYFQDGTQHGEIAENISDALDQMINYLNNN